MTASGGPLTGSFGLTVNPHNVLGVRAVVLQEAHDLQNLLNNEEQYVMLPALGRDPVSGDMSAAFNAATHDLLSRANDHVTVLLALGAELAATAKTYGHTEDKIAASFTSTDVSRIPASLRQVAGMGTTATRPPANTMSDLFGIHQ